MAKPRIFLSSTFYDLKQVRADLDRFVRDLGYEPILNELGGIPYGKDEKLEEYCYKEISNIDILVSIIGGRFGSESQHGQQSISQMEVKTALDLNKQVYIFIDKNVSAEYQTYLLNKELTGVKYRFADNIKIFEFIEFVQKLPNNNNMHDFENSNDIMVYLKEQWAGLFQRFLAEQPRVKEITLLKGMESTAKTLNQLVNFLTEERKDKDAAIQDILRSNHPAMERIRNLLKVSYRVYFTTLDEFKEWLSARGFKVVDSHKEDFLFCSIDAKERRKHFVSVDSILFNEEGKLKAMTKDDWKDEYISIYSEDIVQASKLVDDSDDLPF